MGLIKQRIRGGILDLTFIHYRTQRLVYSQKCTEIHGECPIILLKHYFLGALEMQETTLMHKGFYGFVS